MASFLRGKQAGIQHDLSAAILPDWAESIRYGIASQISCLAYEPVQSLLAVGTNETKFGPGAITVFGIRRVHKVLVPPRPCSFRRLQFVADRLISLDGKGELAVWDLAKSGTRVAQYSAPGGAVEMVTDPMLDWAFLGTASGDVAAYDLDCERGAPFRIPNLWRKHDPRAKVTNLVTMALHPRDIGKLLIAYSTGAVIYSFKQNAPVKFFEYELKPGAPGGNGEAPDSVRKPRLTAAAWHPAGTFLVTAHEDGSLVFWDVSDGRILMARSLYANNVNQSVAMPEHPSLMDPFVRISWCCKKSPDDTGLLIAGGRKVDDPEKGMTFIDLGTAPIYATSSWEILSAHFKGKNQLTLEAPPGAEVVDYCLLPRESPHFAGAQDPIALITLLSSGELITMSVPSGYPISPTNQLHPSLSLVAPFVIKIGVTTMVRSRWLGMEEKRQQGELLIKGGASGTYRRPLESRNIFYAAHGDSTVRIWDIGRGDEIENPHQLQVDVARALNRYEDVNITAMHLAESTGEFAVGTSSGEVVVYRWGGNKFYGLDQPKALDPNPGGLSDIASRAEPSLKEGLQPLVLYEMMQGPISALSVSDVGFVACGSEAGFFSIIDLRGPSVIYSKSMKDFSKPEKKGLFKSHSSSSNEKEWPVVITFGVLTLGEESFSALSCFVGTNLGRVLTFKLVPQGSSYAASLSGVTSLDDKSRVVAIYPIVAETGAPAAATGDAMAGLKNGQKVNGTLVVVTQTEIRIFRPPSQKGASKSFDNILCDAAAVAEHEKQACVVALFGDRTARAFSLPGLKELGRKQLAMLDASRGTGNLISRTGEIIGWTGPSEFTVVHSFGTANGIEPTTDTMINPELKTPPRPTISNLQWISGTQYVSPTDLDILVGGPDRPPSKRMTMATEEESRLARVQGATGAARGQEGWGDYLTRQLNERTERLNLMGEQMDNLQDSTASWAEEASKFVQKQKRSMFLGSVTKGLFK